MSNSTESMIHALDQWIWCLSGPILACIELWRLDEGTEHGVPHDGMLVAQ